MTAPAKRRRRRALPPDQRRSARLSMRTYPEIAAKAQRLGTAAIEALIRSAQEP